ncbi:ATP-binding protein [Variovorax dokdonensis]|uniref:histidine kinase n=1 Tax=Variovorax dokdonensis TaxID=344883 RepID=A0ABT7N6R2_9BURK|nr:ATP-binding protein [Variovorax dokdonensis]MDM0043631.1 ATP-binding protein [Variovorax dokdonensis]
MNRARDLWRRMAEPSLVRRSTLAMIPVFLVIWLTLLGYVYWDNRTYLAEAPGLKSYGDSLLTAVDDLPEEAEARAFIAATLRSTNLRRKDDRRLSGSLSFELARANGGIAVFTSPGWRWEEGEATTRPEITTTQQHWRYDKTRGEWRLRILNPRRTHQAFLSYNARGLVPYLLIALPLVMLAIALTMRRSLRPLSQLAQRIDARSADDLRPVGIQTRHHELAPLVQALDALLLRLRATVERERAFVQDAAHEMRTPLAVIGAQAHVLARSNDSAARAEAGQHLDQAIARAAHLSNQLLTLAALDGAQDRQARTLDLASWLRDALARSASAAAARGIDLELDSPDALSRNVDLPAFDSILQNLLENAVRHGRQGGRVLVRLLPNGPNGWRLSVQDDGAGVAQADRPHLFERFFRSPTVQASGTGLGLAIVRQAAQRMGGSASLIEGLAGRGLGVLVETSGPAEAPRA